MVIRRLAVATLAAIALCAWATSCAGALCLISGDATPTSGASLAVWIAFAIAATWSLWWTRAHVAAAARVRTSP